MQREFESVLGRLITNRSAYEFYKLDTEGFLNHYILSPGERFSLESMRDDLEQLNQEFAAKRKDALKAPIKRSLSLLEEYGDLLLERYLDIYPPSTYFQDRERFFGYLINAIKSSQQPRIVEDIVYMENYWFFALNTILAGEGPQERDLGVSNIKICKDEDSTIRIRKGVYFRDFTYNLTYFPKLSLEEILNLKKEPTSLIVYRRPRERSNTIMRVTPLVNKTMELLAEDKDLSEIARKLSDGNGEPAEVVEGMLITTVKSLLSEGVLDKHN